MEEGRREGGKEGWKEEASIVSFNSLIVLPYNYRLTFVRHLPHFPPLWREGEEEEEEEGWGEGRRMRASKACSLS